MSEIPKKKKTYSSDLYIGSGGESREIQVEWDVLAAASDRCLVGRARGFLEREVVRKTPASMIWRLRNYDLGDLGTCEVHKIRPGWSQVTFSGLGFKGFESDERWEIKQRHMRDVIDIYYFLLSQEGICSPDGSRAGSETNSVEIFPSWEHIPDKGFDRMIIENWCKHHASASQISKAVNGMEIGTIYNKISKLRRAYPEARIPFYRDRNR